MLAGPGRFHRSIERQQIGLKGDLVDAFDHLEDVLARLADLAHGTDHGAHLLVALGRQAAGLFGKRSGLARIFGVEPGLGRNLIHRTGDLLQGAGLADGPLGERLTRVGNLRGAGIDLLAGGLHLPQHAVEVLTQFFQRPAHHVLVVDRLDLKPQIATGQLLQRSDDFLLQIVGKGIERPGHIAELIGAPADIQTGFNPAPPQLLRHLHGLFQRPDDSQGKQGEIYPQDQHRRRKGRHQRQGAFLRGRGQVFPGLFGKPV